MAIEPKSLPFLKISNQDFLVFSFKQHLSLGNTSDTYDVTWCLDNLSEEYDATWYECNGTITLIFKTQESMFDFQLRYL
jgi:hypothetical protein